MRFEKYTVENTERVSLMSGDQVLFTVAPGFGARLMELNLPYDGGFKSVLWPISLKELISNEWYKQCILFPYPNRLDGGKYSFQGVDYAFPINEPATNNQLHGMVANAAFEVTSTEIVENIAVVKLTHSYDGHYKYYPFAYSLSVSYALGAKDFTVMFEVKNTGLRDMPFGLGWHPYFALEGAKIDESRFRCAGLVSLELGERSLPTGKKVPLASDIIELNGADIDNAYLLKDSRSYHLLAGEDASLNFITSGEMDYLQLFIPPDRGSIAVEPMTCNVNAFNNGDGLRILKPDEYFESKVKVNLQPV